MPLARSFQNLARKMSEKDQVIQAINSLGRRVTVADVATKTGLPLLVVNKELNQVALEASGQLEVATTGDIAYKFAPGFQSAYLAKGLKRVLQDFGQKAFQIGFFILRISFGVMLILSLLTVVLLVFAVIFYSATRGGNNDSDGDTGFSFDFFDFMIFRDLLWWNYDPYGSATRVGYDKRYDDYLQGRSAKREGNFFVNTFSFLFGDGDPNSNLEEKRWHLVAASISAHDNAITAEQLAPYTGQDAKDDNGVLPVLVRFDGKPEVSENGNIIYLFPSLSATAQLNRGETLPTYLEEKPWVFSAASNEELLPVILLAIVNFFGSLWLFSVHTPLTNALAPLILVLVVYGSLFITIPLVRFGVITMLNKGIEKRNAERADFAMQLRNPTAKLATKLKEAQGLAKKSKMIASIVYTTERDVLEQEFDTPPHSS